MIRDPDDVAACFVCGCRDDVACPGGCAWTWDEEGDGLDLCTACVELRDELVAAGRPVTLDQLADWTGEQRDQAAAWIAGESASALEPAWLGGLGG